MYNKLEFIPEKDFVKFIGRLEKAICSKFQSHIIDKGYSVKPILNKDNVFKCRLKDMEDGDTSIYCYYKGEDEPIEDLDASSFQHTFKVGDKFKAAFRLAGIKVNEKKEIRIIYELHSIIFLGKKEETKDDSSSDEESGLSDSDEDSDLSDSDEDF